MRLLALDLATTTGFAFGEHVAVPRYGVAKLPSRPGEVGRFVAAFDEWLSDFIVLERPDWVVYECPVMMHGDKANLDATRKLMGLAAVAELVCFRRNITVREANVSTIKKFWSGNGRAKKNEMVEAAQRWGFATKNHNEADALGLWSYQVHHKFEDQRHRWAMGDMGAAA